MDLQLQAAIAAAEKGDWTIFLDQLRSMLANKWDYKNLLQQLQHFHELPLDDFLNKIHPFFEKAPQYYDWVAEYFRDIYAYELKAQAAKGKQDYDYDRPPILENPVYLAKNIRRIYRYETRRHFSNLPVLVPWYTLPVIPQSSPPELTLLNKPQSDSSPTKTNNPVLPECN